MIKLLKPYLKQMYGERLWMFSGFFLVVIAGAAGIALLGLSGWFISVAAFSGLSIVSAAQFNYLLPGASVRLFAYIRIVARYGERVINHEAIFRLISSLRVWLFNHLTALSPMQLTFINNGDLLNRFMSDIGALDNLFIRIITPFFSTLLLIIASAIFLYFLNVSVAVISLISILVLLMFLFVVLGFDHKTSRAYQQATNNLRSFVTQVVQALPEIFLFNTIKIQIDALDKYLKEISQIQKKLSKKNGIAQAMLTAGMGTILIVSLLLTTKATIIGNLNGANIIVISLVIVALGELLQPIITAFLLLGQTEQAATNINAITAVKSIFNAPVRADFEIKHDNLIITISDVVFSHENSKKLIFNKLNLIVPEAAHLVLIGPSGAGKTTLINLIARFMRPQSGKITINNYDIYTLTDQQWQSLFCIVPQNPYLFDITLRENLLLANPAATDEMCWYALEVCQLKAFIASLPGGLDTYIGKNGEHLSGGQARRVALARAVLRSAPITILDEPTEGLDNATEEAIMHALREHFHHKTLLVVSHRPPVISLFPSVMEISRYFHENSP